MKGINLPLCPRCKLGGRHEYSWQCLEACWDEITRLRAQLRVREVVGGASKRTKVRAVSPAALPAIAGQRELQKRIREAGKRR